MSQNLARSQSKKLERFISSCGKLKDDLQLTDDQDLESNPFTDNKCPDSVDSPAKSVKFYNAANNIKKKQSILNKFQYMRQWSRDKLRFDGSLRRLLLKIVQENETRNAPYFTIWLVFVEVALFFVMFAFHPDQHSAFWQKNVTSIVWHQSNSYQEVTYSKPGNPWYGPSNEVLIHHGAVFTPCMHMLEKTRFEREKAKDEENRSGCCLRMEYNTCCQSLPEKCSNRTSHLLKPYPGRSSATVCGMDPDFCEDEDRSSAKQSISEWKPCRERKARSLWPKTEALHMNCKVLARPCTYGIYQQCMFATEQFCTFLNGNYHPEAYLCSQVNPISDICGWTTPDSPDEQPRQYARLLFALFMHAGVFHLAISVFFQLYYLRHFEESVGTWKIMVIYFVSGILANVASAVFLPLTPYIGPNGANIGTYSFFYYHFISNWNRYVSPWKPFLKNSIYLAFVFALGTILPWINNFALIAGFVFGLLLMFTLSKVPNERSLCQRTRTFSFRLSFLLLVSLSGLLLFTFLMTDGFSGRIAEVINRLNCAFGEEWCRIKTNVNIHVKALTVRS